MISTIRHRLMIAFIVLAITPLLLIGSVLAWQSFSVQQQQALTLQREVARRVSLQIDTAIHELEHNLSQLDQVEGFQQVDSSHQAHLLARLLAYQEAFNELVLLDQQGYEQFRFSRVVVVDPNALANRSNQIEFLQPRRTGQTYYSPVLFDSVGEPVMIIAYPLTNLTTRRMTGVLVAQVRLRKIWDLLQTIQADEDIYMVDSQGQMVAHWLSPVVMTGAQVTIPAQDGLHSGLSGTTVVLVAEPLRLGDQLFYIMVERPISQAFALAINTLLITGGVVGVALLAAGGFGGIIAHQIVRPIEILAATAQAITAGDLAQRARVSGPGEIRLLADSFNQMTDQLRQTLASQARFVAILEETPDLVAMIDNQGYLLYLNQAGRQLVGLEVEEAIGGLHFSGLYAAEFAAVMLEERLTVAKTRGIWRGEDIFLSRGGREIPISQVILAHRAAEGQIAFFAMIIRDITERKQGEKALARRTTELEEAHNFLDSLIENLPAMLFVKEAKSLRLVRWNKGAEEISGRERSLVVGKTDYDFVPQEQAEFFTKIDHEVLAGGQLREIAEEPITTQSGEIRYLHTRKVPILDSAGQPQYLLGISLDITGRKLTEAALRQSEQRLELALAGADLALWDWNIQTNELVVNQRWADLLGYSLAEISPQGRSWDNRLHPADAASVEAVLNAYLAGEIPVYEAEYRLQTRAGEWLWVLDRGKVVEQDAEGRPLRMVGTHLDVTARKQAEAALYETSETLKTLIQASPLAIDVIDLQGRVTLWNPAAERLFGWAEAEVLGRTLPIIPAGQQESFHAWLTQEFKSWSQMPLEVRRMRKDGSLVELNLWTAPLNDDQGKTVAVMGILSDITERKQLEEQLRQSQKMEAIGRLAGGVAHDFNNILTVITGYTEFLLDDCLDNYNPRCQDIEQIRLAAERAASLTRQLLAFSRQQILQPEILNLNIVITNLNKMLARLIGEDIELVTRLRPGLGQVKIDPGQIEQVIMNVAVNARDAMPQGGQFIIETINIELDAKTVRRYIGVAPGPYVMVCLRDTGQGMDAETRSRIFEPFFTTKEQGKGTGLGLATVHGIVTQSGGHIWVDSEPGQGATFRIYLPRIDRPLEPAEPEHYITGVRAGSETILLVEDEDRVRELAQRVLSRQGYQVLEAHHGLRALELFKSHPGPIHMLVTDMIMPNGVSGRALAEQLLALQPEMKVLYISGYIDNDIISYESLEPSTAFLQKPFTPATLARKVREVLDQEA